MNELTVLDERRKQLEVVVVNQQLQIEHINTIQQAREEQAKLKAWQELAKSVELDEKVRQQMALNNVLLIRQIGVMIQEMQEIGAVRIKGESKPSCNDSLHDKSTLSDYGITRMQSSRAQKLTKVSDDEIRSIAVAKSKQGKRITINAVNDYIQNNIIKKERQQERAEKKRIDNKPSTKVDIYHCNIEELASMVEPNSVHAIITDPPYPKEFLNTYELLAEFASYALVDGGVCLAMAGQSYLPEIYAMMSKHLTYNWTCDYTTRGAQAVQIWRRRIITYWKPVLFYSKGEYKGDWLSDVFKSEKNDKSFHHWGQSESGIGSIVEAVTYPNQLVCDPFVGGGTTAVVCHDMKRSFVGCDIELEAVNKSLERVYNG
jgi:16S rRNA G966 N2-methylase RsmD